MISKYLFLIETLYMTIDLFLIISVRLYSGRSFFNVSHSWGR